MPRMRNAKEAFNEIKQEDPNTKLTLHAVKQIVRTEQIPVVHIGRRCLIDMDSLYKYLGSGR